MIAHLELVDGLVQVKTREGPYGSFPTSACLAFVEEMKAAGTPEKPWSGWASVSVTRDDHLIVHCLVDGPQGPPDVPGVEARGVQEKCPECGTPTVAWSAGAAHGRVCPTPTCGFVTKQ